MEKIVTTFTISNIGYGTLDYTLVPTKSWIDIEPLTGEITTETDTITVTIDRNAVPESIQMESISILYYVGEVQKQPQIPVYVNGVMGLEEEKYYRVVRIGDQIWMAENLNFHAESGSWVYDDNPENATLYGRLYDWETACMVCPEGWHLPSDIEWKQLEVFLGIKFYHSDFQYLPETGKYMKEAGALHWSSANTAINNTGFSALPGGLYGICFTDFCQLGISAAFWSSSQYDYNNAWTRDFYHAHNDGYRGYYSKEFRLSVRCVKDE